MKLDFECIVVGAGVAGMTAAMYLKRSVIEVAIIEKSYPGGQINKTYTIKNYPGYKEIDGPTLTMNIMNQLEDLNIPIYYELVETIEDNGEYKTIKTNINTYKTKKIVIASGRSPRELGIENEKELIGKGISWCATCDGNLYKNEPVAVVGGGNTAMEDALYLSAICKKVYLINRGPSLRADKILINEVKDKKNIHIMLNSTINKLCLNDSKLKSIELSNNKKYDVSAIFEAIGSEVKLDFISNLNINLENNYILVNDKMQTNISGIYACGDVIKKNLYQIITAASEGAIAANSIKQELSR